MASDSIEAGGFVWPLSGGELEDAAVEPAGAVHSPVDDWVAEKFDSGLSAFGRFGDDHVNPALNRMFSYADERLTPASSDLDKTMGVTVKCAANIGESVTRVLWGQSRPREFSANFDKMTSDFADHPLDAVKTYFNTTDGEAVATDGVLVTQLPLGLLLGNSIGAGVAKAAGAVHKMATHQGANPKSADYADEFRWWGTEDRPITEAPDTWSRLRWIAEASIDEASGAAKIALRNQGEIDNVHIYRGFFEKLDEWRMPARSVEAELLPKSAPGVRPKNDEFALFMQSIKSGQSRTAAAEELPLGKAALGQGMKVTSSPKITFNERGGIENVWVQYSRPDLSASSASDSVAVANALSRTRTTVATGPAGR